MQRMAVVRLSLPSTSPSATKKDFWTNYWQSSSPTRSPAPDDNERALIQEFGTKLAQKISRVDRSWRDVRVEVRGVRYGSIELLLLVIGGEELLSEMFWTVLEFSAPEAFNDTVNGNVALQAHVSPGQGGLAGGAGGHGGGAGGHGFNRALAAARTPLTALILGAVIIIYLLMWRVESLEKEYTALHHDHTSVVNKLTEQNTVLTTGLMLRLGIPVPPGKDEHKQEGKAETSTPSHSSQTQAPPASSPLLPPPAGSPHTKAEPAPPTQISPSPTSEPQTGTSSSPQPNVQSSPQGEKRGESH